MRSRGISVGTLASIALIAGGCSLKQPSSHSVRIAFERKPNAQARIARSGEALQISSLDDFNCFGVRVSGAGIAPDPRESCGASPAVGRLAGLVPLSGGVVEVAVPAGTRRLFEVFAFKSASGCPGISTLLERAPASRLEGVGRPHLIGSQVADILADTTVEIQASYDPAAPQTLFAGCGEGGSGIARTRLQQAWFGAGLVKATSAQANIAAAGTFVLGAWAIPNGGIAAPTGGTIHHDLQLETAETAWADDSE
jgi:hypothetical protein